VLFLRPLLERPHARQVAGQLLNAATSVAANYRAVCRARSHAEFTAKLCIVLEEADEAQFWLEFLRDCSLADSGELTALIEEAGELVAIFTAARRTAKSRN
jgi:four helix bundle protein